MVVAGIKFASTIHREREREREIFVCLFNTSLSAASILSKEKTRNYVHMASYDYVKYGIYKIFLYLLS